MPATWCPSPPRSPGALRAGVPWGYNAPGTLALEVACLLLVPVLAAGLIMAACGPTGAAGDSGSPSGDGGGGDTTTDGGSTTDGGGDTGSTSDGGGSTDGGGDTGSTSDGGSGDTGSGTDGGATGDTAPTCADFHAGLVADGTVVALDDVVATSGLTTDNAGFFVQDPGSGAAGGLYVALADSVDASILRRLEPGQRLALAGIAEVGTDGTRLRLSSSDDIETTMPADMLAAFDLAAPPADWQEWEGQLVSLVGPTATGATDTDGSCPLDWGISLDSGFTPVTVSAGTSWDRITGEIMRHGHGFAIEPRTADDLVAAGATATAVTVGSLNGSGYHAGDPVLVRGVVATSRMTLSYSEFTIQDAGGGARHGVMVQLPTDIRVSPGDELTITGSYDKVYSEFANIVMLDASDPTDVVKTGTAAETILVLDPTTTDWGYGDLVRLDDVDIVAGYYTGETYTSWRDIGLYDAFVDCTSAVYEGDHFSSITGVMFAGWDTSNVAPRDCSELVP